MTHSDSDVLKQILSDEPLREDDPATQAIARQLDRKRKRLLIDMTVWLVVCIGIILGGARLLFANESTRIQLFGLFVMLVGAESTVLIKLWYWIARTAARTQYEVKHLSLLTVAGSQATTASADVGDGRRWLDRGSIKTWEWMAGVVLIAMGVLLAFALVRSSGRNTIGSNWERHVVVHADGSAVVRQRKQSQSGMIPNDKAYHWFAKPVPVTDFEARDQSGTLLPWRVEHHGERPVYVMDLPHTLYHGDPRDIRIQYRIVDAVEHQDGTLTYTDHAWLPHIVRVTRTISLPGDATLVSARPEPEAQWQQDGHLVLRFAFRRVNREHVDDDAIRVTYRLPTATQPKTAPASNSHGAVTH